MCSLHSLGSRKPPWAHALRIGNGEPCVATGLQLHHTGCDAESRYLQRETAFPEQISQHHERQTGNLSVLTQRDSPCASQSE